jgi:cardiolipin synthase
MKNTNESNTPNFINILKKYFRKEDIFKVPNILCYVRILLVVAFMVFYLVPITILGNHRAGTYIAVAMMMIAAYTDFIDGFIARTFDQKSNLGSLLDPIADKFMQFCIAIALMVKFYSFPTVFVMFGVFMGKELTLVFEDISLAKRSKTFGGAKWYGKVASFLFYIITVFLLIAGPFLIETFPVVGENATAETIRVAHYIFDSCCAFATLWLLVSWILYFVFYLKLRNSKTVISDTKDQKEPGKELADHD